MSLLCFAIVWDKTKWLFLNVKPGIKPAIVVLPYVNYCNAIMIFC